MADLERENKKAPRVNPEKSGIRTGNPQLDPERARKKPSEPGEEPHRPEPTPPGTKSPNR